MLKILGAQDFRLQDEGLQDQNKGLNNWNRVVWCILSSKNTKTKARAFPNSSNA